MDLSPPPLSPPFLEVREGLIQSPLAYSIGSRVVRIFSNARGYCLAPDIFLARS